MTEEEILQDIHDWKVAIESSKNVIKAEENSIARYFKFIAERYDDLEKLRQEKNGGN
jgi:hypothetical protein